MHGVGPPGGLQSWATATWALGKLVLRHNKASADTWPWLALHSCLPEAAGGGPPKMFMFIFRHLFVQAHQGLAC